MTGLSRQITRPALDRPRSRALLVLAWALVLALGAAAGYGGSGRRPLRGAPQCSCVTPPPPREALAASAAVFDGTVSRVALDLSRGGGNAFLTMTFVVHTQWKGIVQSPVIVETSVWGSLCGYPMALGKRYLVYAYGNSKDLWVSSCSRTRPYDDAEARELGPNEPPADAVPYPIWSVKPPLACPDCAPALPPLEALAKADAVWHGQPLSIEDLGPGEGHDHRVVYRNLGWWKGDSAPTVPVRVPYTVFACDPSLWAPSAGLTWREHLVFAMAAPEGGWELRLCGQTRFYDAAQAAQLGRPQATAEPTAVSNPTLTPTPLLTATPPICPTMECPGCPGPQPARSWLAQADAVFLGRVLDHRQVACDHIVRFKVLERFKGAQEDDLEVFVNMTSWQCQRSYALGDESVIFAKQDASGGLYHPFCFGIVAGDPLDELRRPGPSPEATLTPMPTLTASPEPSATLLPGMLVLPLLRR